MDARQRLQATIDRQRERLRATVPSEREEAILALVRFRDLQRDGTVHREAVPDIVTGVQVVDPGGNIALQLLLDSDGGGARLAPDTGVDAWLPRFQNDCDAIALAEQVLWHVESGFMRMVVNESGRFDAWIATSRAPVGWRERADFDWWAAWDATRTGSRVPTDVDPLLDGMAHQLRIPDDAVIDGVSMREYREVLRRLADVALHERGPRDDPRVWPDQDLMATLGRHLEIDQAFLRRAVAALTVDRENVVWHAAVPGISPAPVIRIDPDTVVLSRSGLTRQPLLFLGRELRRRVAQDYHAAAALREDVFRQDLYTLFEHRRFVTSPNRIVLRREDRKVRTDIDAAVFDRKTGALAVFELKSMDPYARSLAEQERQRDNLDYASRQVGNILDWINRHGADEILSRYDRGVAKSFRVRNVYPFVLGRYVVHGGDTSRQDRRSAWGSWPQVLRITDGGTVDGMSGNPIASLHARLMQDESGLRVPSGLETMEIGLGSDRLVVHPSHAAWRGSD